MTKTGGEAADFYPQVSHFLFLRSSSRPGLEYGTPPISGFSILSANRGTGDDTILGFGFLIPHSGFNGGPCTSQNHVLLGSHFAFPCSKPALRLWDLRCAHFSIRVSPFCRHIRTGNLPYGTLLVLRVRLQMEMGFDHYSPHPAGGRPPDPRVRP